MWEWGTLNTGPFNPFYAFYKTTTQANFVSSQIKDFSELKTDVKQLKLWFS
jgi:hypothetical protein